MKKNTKGKSRNTKTQVQPKRSELTQKPFILSRYIAKNKQTVGKIMLATFLLVLIVGAIPFSYTYAKDDIISFGIENEKHADLELGESKVFQEGRDGKKSIIIESRQSMWGRLLGWQPIQQKEVSSTITERPVNKVVANGTRKYQYMLCSDGSSRYYTDEQFKDPQTGFTSKSEDYCKENNQGHKVRLSDSNPSNIGASSASRPTGAAQPDTYEADKIKRETEKLLWCIEQEERIGNEYISKVHQAQAMQDITNQEFNTIVDPAYWKYSLNIGELKSSGCTIINPYPDFTRR